MLTLSQWIENLKAQGYREVPEYTGWGYTLKPGDRVKKSVEGWGGYQRGESVVEKIFDKESTAGSVRHSDIQLVLKNADGTYSFLTHNQVKKVIEGE